MEMALLQSGHAYDDDEFNTSHVQYSALVSLCVQYYFAAAMKLKY